MNPVIQALLGVFTPQLMAWVKSALTVGGTALASSHYVQNGADVETIVSAGTALVGVALHILGALPSVLAAKAANLPQVHEVVATPQLAQAANHPAVVPAP